LGGKGIGVNGADIAAQVGAAGGLWTHTPVDWAGNEVAPPAASPTGWPLQAAIGSGLPGNGTRPGNGTTQSGPAGAPVILSAFVTNVTTTGFGVAVTFGATVTSSRVNYGVTQAMASNAAGTTAAAQTISVGSLTTKTTYYFTVQATNGNGTTVSSMFTVTTA
jgi:hypothetical protein